MSKSSSRTQKLTLLPGSFRNRRCRRARKGDDFPNAGRAGASSGVASERLAGQPGCANQATEPHETRLKAFLTTKDTKITRKRIIQPGAVSCRFGLQSQMRDFIRVYPRVLRASWLLVSVCRGTTSNPKPLIRERLARCCSSCFSRSKIPPRLRFDCVIWLMNSQF